MEKLVSSDGVLEFETRIQIWFFDAVLVLLGLFLIWYSRSVPAGDVLRHSLRTIRRLQP
jgi:hypothetical protein